ncbi:hypothetical protein [Actinoplanes sp. NPDC051859]|uniref:hypothetical protein n=1 Tax=Actinoplanes sp. NPDC051859 TaxID=3363909 RepID=UPI00379491FE
MEDFTRKRQHDFRDGRHGTAKCLVRPVTAGTRRLLPAAGNPRGTTRSESMTALLSGLFLDRCSAMPQRYYPGRHSQTKSPTGGGMVGATLDGEEVEPAPDSNQTASSV